jgi:hypothetical protein
MTDSLLIKQRLERVSHRLMSRSLLAMLTAFVLMTCLASNLAAQDFPSKPIRILVPAPPGGGSDTNARLVATHMAKTLGQSVIVENRPGASGIIADMAVVQAKPDGYTVLYEIFSFAVNPSMRTMPFDAAKDLQPVSQVLNMTNILVVPAAAPYQTLQEFLAYARAHPGELTYASYGNGGTAHLAGEMLARDAGIKWLHVPYKGGTPAVADLLAGQVSAYFANPISGLPHIQTGRLRALAVTSQKRLDALPNVPTFIESGLRDFEVLEWNGMFVPAQTPAAVVQKLNEAIVQALAAPEIRERMTRVGIEPVGNTPNEFGAFVNAELLRWAQLVKTNDIKAE